MSIDARASIDAKVSIGAQVSIDAKSIDAKRSRIGFETSGRER
jgi:UDP-3-O-[3-hydroxymyristoyl] glucosamine N-acyltransferase